MKETLCKISGGAIGTSTIYEAIKGTYQKRCVPFALYGNCSAGLRIHHADPTKTWAYRQKSGIAYGKKQLQIITQLLLADALHEKGGEQLRLYSQAVLFCVFSHGLYHTKRRNAVF